MIMQMVAVVSGVVVNIVTAGIVIWRVGRWTGNIEATLKDIIKRMDLSDEKYGPLCERVATLEGMHQKDKQ